MTIAELIDDRLKQLGQRRSWLRHALAERGVSVTRQAVHHWVTGRGHPQLSSMLELWSVLDVPPDQRQEWLTAMSRRPAA